MTPADTTPSLRELEARIAELLKLARKLAEENRVLRQGHEQLAAERAQLLSKNEQARSRVEAMINRLKGLEQGG